MNFQFNIQEILNPKHDLTQDEIQALRNEFDQEAQKPKVD